MTSFREYREQGPTAPDDNTLKSMPRETWGIQGERAGFVSRTVAACIDVTLVFLVVLGTIAALWMISFIVDPTSPGSQNAASGDRIPAAALMVLYGYFLNWLYWTVCWATSGRTLGNLVMGLKVVNFRGHHQRWGGAAIRSLFCTTFPFGLLWVIPSGANRSVQDVVLRTSVIYDWVLKTPSLANLFERASDKDGS
jgi:uncharacterized RDD family membrane protein YckC